MVKLLVAGLIFAVLSGAHAQTYVLHLTQQEKPGQRFDVKAHGSNRQLVSSDGAILQAESFQVAFEGGALIDDVDKAGEAYRISLTIKSFTKSTSGSTTELLKTGTVVIVDGSRRDDLVLLDGTLDKASKDALEVLFSPHKPDSATDDDIMATKGAHAVGDTWLMNSALAVADLQKSVDIDIPQDRIKGLVTFAGLEKHGAANYAHVSADTNVGTFTSSGKNGMSVKHGVLSAKFDGSFPLDDQIKSFRTSARIHASFELSPGTRVVNISLDREAEVIWVAVSEVF